MPQEVAHYAPVPDPEARFGGTTWLWPAIREVMADGRHPAKLTLENGATPNMVTARPQRRRCGRIELFKEGHEGASNAYKTLFIGAGTEAISVGAMPEQIDFKVTQVRETGSPQPQGCPSDRRTVRRLAGSHVQQRTSEATVRRPDDAASLA